MSRDVSVDFEVRSIEIMKETLTAMRIGFKEQDEHRIKINKSFHDIVIDSETGKISYDEMNKSEVNKICQRYMVNWYKDRAIREGNTIQEEVMANGEVHIHVLN